LDRRLAQDVDGFEAIKHYRRATDDSGLGLRRVLAMLAVLALLAEVVVVAAVSIRNLDDTVRERLRIRAAAHGRSMEAEMRAILVEAVRETGDDEGVLGALVERFGELGGIDLDAPSRSAPPRAVDFTT
jgi:plasmid stability protein